MRIVPAFYVVDTSGLSYIKPHTLMSCADVIAVGVG